MQVDHYKKEGFIQVREISVLTHQVASFDSEQWFSICGRGRSINMILNGVI